MELNYHADTLEEFKKLEMDLFGMKLDKYTYASIEYDGYVYYYDTEKVDGVYMFKTDGEEKRW